jgi:hypothetical protein
MLKSSWPVTALAGDLDIGVSPLSLFVEAVASHELSPANAASARRWRVLVCSKRSRAASYFLRRRYPRMIANVPPRSARAPAA